MSVPVVVDAVVVVEGLGAALCFAGSSACKHASAVQVDAASLPDVRGSVGPTQRKTLGGFLTRTMQHPLWLTGIAADAGGLALQVLALHRGALAVVQPLLLSSLVFALVMQGITRGRVSLKEIGWAGSVVVLLAAFTVLCASSPGSAPDGVDRLPALVAGLAGLVVVAGSVFLGVRHHSAPGRPTLLGFAAGILYATTAALLKSLTTTVSTLGLAHLVLTWQLYAVVVVGAAGVAVTQLAFRSGPLAAGLPVAGAIDALLSIGIGVVLFDERVRLGPGHGLVLGLLLTGLSVAVLQLARTESAPFPS